MSHAEPRYALARAEGGPELERLRMLEAINDPATIRRLDEIGVAEGWRCLEVGAGGGSVTRALAERAGASGRVAAVDMDPRFLGDLGLANVDVVKHDITHGPVAPGGYDLAHCRAVLTHVHGLAGALHNLLESVRSGGVVFVEEPDYGAMEPCDEEHPGAAIFVQYRDSFLHGDHMDAFAGRNVYRELQTAGCVDIRSEAIGAVVHGGSLRALYRKKTMENVRARAIEGAYTAESFQRLMDVFEDPTFRYVDNLWVGVIALRP